MLGPPLAGIVIATLGTGAALWLDAASFVLSAVAVAIAIPAPFRKRTIEASSGGYLAELAAGLQFIRREPLVRSIVLVYAATELLDAPLVAVALPVYAETIFNSPTQLGLMVGSLGAGSLAGSVLFGIFGHRLSRRLTFFTSLLVLQLPYWVLVAIPPLPIVAVALFIMGLAAGPLNALLYTIVQERTPTEMTGRVMGILAAGGMATVPLGMALCGYTLETIGLQPTLFGLAAIYIAVTLLFGLSTALRKMDEYEIGNDANSRHRSSVARQSERSLRS
jgi:MFS family permease